MLMLEVQSLFWQNQKSSLTNKVNGEREIDCSN